MDLQVAVLKADPHNAGTPIYQIVSLGPCRSKAGRPTSGSCALQCASSTAELALL